MPMAEQRVLRRPARNAREVRSPFQRQAVRLGPVSTDAEACAWRRNSRFGGSVREDDSPPFVGGSKAPSAPLRGEHTA
jgi:hypothetical protein